MEQEIDFDVYSKPLATLGNLNLENIIGRQKTKANHERGDLVGQLVDELNKTAKPQVTWKQINGQLRGYTNHGIYILMQECSRARNYGAFFWWKLKENKKRAKIQSV